MSTPHEPVVLASLIRRIQRAIALQESPEFVPCSRCHGKGYHHGFGENGVDPDWCLTCGGPGEVAHPDFDLHDPVDVLREVLSALLAAPVQASEKEEDTRVETMGDGNHSPTAASNTLIPALRSIATYRPWEYYGAYDDQRCFFCGRDKNIDNRGPEDDGDGDAHESDCPWIRVRSFLAGLPAALLSPLPQGAEGSPTAEQKKS